ncbi:hypothetical protein RFI_37681, partial [Reticulomyxa filosa]
MEWYLIANNFNHFYDVAKSRIAMIQNTFTFNNVTNLISWRNDHWSNEYVLGPVVHLWSNTFTKNNAWNIIHMNGPDLSQSTYNRYQRWSIVYVITSEVIKIDMYNIIITHTNVLYLNDTRSSLYGANV